MKRTLSLLICIIMCLTVFIGCDADTTETAGTAGGGVPERTRAANTAEQAGTTGGGKPERTRQSDLTSTAPTTTAPTTTAPPETTTKVSKTKKPVKEDVLPLIIHNQTYLWFTNYSNINNSFYIHEDGNLYANGDTFGNKGGTDTSHHTPENRELIAEGVRSINELGRNNYGYIKDDNSLWVFGQNSKGELCPQLDSIDEDGFAVKLNYIDADQAVKIADDVATIIEVNNTAYVIKLDKELTKFSAGKLASVTKNVVNVLDDDLFLLATGDLLKSGKGKQEENVLDYFYGLLITLDNKLMNGDKVLAEDVVKAWNWVNHGLMIESGQDVCLRIIKTDGTLWSMGDNKYGQLGDGTKTDRKDFVKIADNVKQMGSDWYLTEDGNFYQISTKSAAHILKFENIVKVKVNEEGGLTQVYSADGTVYNQYLKKDAAGVKPPTDVVIG